MPDVPMLAGFTAAALVHVVGAAVREWRHLYRPRSYYRADGPEELASGMRGSIEGQRVIQGLAASIAAIHRPHPLRVAIDGVDAAGSPGGSRKFKRATFDVRTDQAIDSPLERASPDAILLLDGVFLLRTELRQHFDFVVFLRVGFNVSLARGLARDVDLLGTADAVHNRYQKRYIPGPQLYFERTDPERWASVVIDNNDLDRPIVVAPDLIAT